MSNVARTYDWILLSWKNRMPHTPLLSFQYIRLLCSSKEIPIKNNNQRNITFLINFLPPDTGIYHIDFIQNVTPPFQGVSTVVDIPPDGFLSALPVTWPVSVFILSDLPPIDTVFRIQSIAKIIETGDADTTITELRVVTDQASPSLLPLSSYPSALQIFDSTEVTFSTVLEGTENAPSSMHLQEVDSTGNVMESIGLLRDDSTSGDLTPADFVYSGLFLLSYSTETPRYFRALAVYGTAGDTVYSPLFELPVTRFPTETINLLTDSLGNPTGRVVYDPTVGDSIISNGVVVSFDKGTAPDRIIGIVNEIGGSIAGTFSSLEFFQIQLPSPGSVGEIHAIMDALSAYSEVESAESIPVDHTTVATPAELRPDPDPNGEYYFDRVRAREAWVISKGKVLISIVDTGIDWDHPDLTGKVRKGRNFLEWKKDKKYNSKDDNGHGTNVASIASARTNNDDVPETQNSAGMSWNSNLLAVKSCGKDGKCANIDGHNGVEYSADKGARVINCSFAGDVHRNYFQRAIDHANAKGSIVVCAAGNKGKNTKFYPAAYSGALAVAATDENDNRGVWPDRGESSNYGTWVDLSAPGTSILAAEMGGDRSSWSGTSQAAPIVSGAAAVIWERFPSATSGTIKKLLKQCAAPLAISGMGSGRLDLFEAVFNGSFEIQPFTETISTFNAQGRLLKTENREIAYWRRSGNVDFITQLSPYAPQDVDGHSGRMAFISTGGAQYNGLVLSSISQRFTIDNTSYEALNNHTLPISLNYNYITEEYPEWVGSIFNDKMRTILKHPSGREELLVYNDINTTPFTMIPNLDLPEGDATTGATGWRSFSAVVNLTDGPGAYELIVSVEDAGDDLWDSVVLVDNIRFRE
jgi:subtilisin family serine protease